MALSINTTLSKSTPEAINAVLEEIKTMTSTSLNLTKKSAEVLIKGIMDHQIMIQSMQIISFFITKSKNQANLKLFLDNSMLDALASVPNDSPIATPTLITLVDDIMPELDENHIKSLIKSVFTKIVTVLADPNIKCIPLGALRLASSLIREFLTFNLDSALEELAAQPLSTLLYSSLRRDDIFLQENIITSLRKCRHHHSDLDSEIMKLLDSDPHSAPFELVKKFRAEHEQIAFIIPLKAYKIEKNGAESKCLMAYFGIQSLVFKVEARVHEYSYKTMNGGKVNSQSFSFNGHDNKRIYLVFADDFSQKDFELFWEDIKPLIKQAKNEVEAHTEHYTNSYLNLDSRSQNLHEMTPTPDEANFRSFTPTPAPESYQMSVEPPTELECSVGPMTPRIRHSPSIEEDLSPSKQRYSIELPTRSFAITPSNFPDDNTDIGSVKAMFGTVLDKLRNVVFKRKKSIKENVTSQTMIQISNLETLQSKDWSDLESQLHQQVLMLDERISRWYEASKRTRSNFLASITREEKEFNDLRADSERVAKEFQQLSEATSFKHSQEFAALEKVIRDTLEKTKQTISKMPEDNAGLLSLLME